MKLSLFLITLLLCSFAKGTNANFEIISQPANLVSDAIPGCIPLASAFCYSNYSYGLHQHISSPHPFLKEAKEWKKGIETNANLASAFGILVRPTDVTQVTSEPVNIVVKDWPVPPYSPHTKAEVLAATIHCLLLSCYATPERPLDLRIVTENTEDQKWAKPFEKKYINYSNEGKKTITPTPVGGSILKTDDFGVRYVFNPKINPKLLTPKALPVFLPIPGFYDGKPLTLRPFWLGTKIGETVKTPLQALALPRGHFYNAFSGSHQFSAEFNPLLSNQEYFSISSKQEDDVIAVHMTFLTESSHQIATTIACAALTAKVQFSKAIKVTVLSYAEDSAIFDILFETPGWEKTTLGRRVAAVATFEYDPKIKKLTKGTLPDNYTLTLEANGQISLRKP